MNRRTIQALLGIALAGLTAGAAIARDRDELKFKIFGNIPLVTGRGVGSAFSPWVTDNSRVELEQDGDVKIRIRGLVIAPGLLANGAPVPPALVGTNPVPVVRIAISWAVPGSPSVVFQETGPLPLDPNGNLHAQSNVGPPPANGERPVVFVRAGGTPGTGVFIGSSDFVSEFGSSHPGDDDD